MAQEKEPVKQPHQPPPKPEPLQPPPKPEVIKEDRKTPLPKRVEPDDPWPRK